MIKHILIELSVGLIIMILVPTVLIADFAIETKLREKNAERAGYTGYLVDFTGYVDMDDGEWFACVEVEESGKKLYIKEGGLSLRNQYKVYVMEDSAEENITADGYTYTVYRDYYGIWVVAPPPYYLAVIAGILIDITIVLPVTLGVLVIIVVVHKIRNRKDRNRI